MARVRRRMLARHESRYRTKTINGATFFTSRSVFGGLAIVIKRFPSRTTVAGPTFVLVHGIGVSSRYFQPAAAELAKLGTVYLVDLPGYGAAPNPRQDVSIKDHAAVLGHFLAGAALRNPVLVGHSMGSQVVSQLAVDNPDASDRLVLMAPTLAPSLRTFWRAVGSLLVDGTREPLAVIAINLVDYWVRCGVPYALKQMPHLLGDRIEDRLPGIAVPTLVIRGDRDPIVSDGWAQALTKLLPRGRFETVRGPHVVMFTDPVAVAALIAGHAARS